MNAFFKSEKGLSLVELLAAVAIGSLLLILVSTAHIFIQKQYNHQTADVKHLTDLTIALKAITKDIRSADPIDEEIHDSQQLILKQGGHETKYHLDDQILKKDNLAYIYDIEKFEVSKEDTKITISIKQQARDEVKMEIVQRVGEPIEE